LTISIRYGSNALGTKGFFYYTGISVDAGIGIDTEEIRPATMNKAEPPESFSSPNSSYELRFQQSLRRITRAVEIHSRKLKKDSPYDGAQSSSHLVPRATDALTISRLVREASPGPGTIVDVVERIEADQGLGTGPLASIVHPEVGKKH